MKKILLVAALALGFGYFAGAQEYYQGLGHGDSFF